MTVEDEVLPPRNKFQGLSVFCPATEAEEGGQPCPAAVLIHGPAPVGAEELLMREVRADNQEEELPLPVVTVTVEEALLVLPSRPKMERCTIS